MSNEVIEFQADDIAQLFHTLDPYPFRDWDLDREAEEYIVGWARELPRLQPIALRVHHPDTTVQAKAALELKVASVDIVLVLRRRSNGSSTNSSELADAPLLSVLQF
ncbi:MAG TPA: hypothetical protein VG986_03460 [Pseudolabrys sp.]|nr:hypothetical protein [Pseudolabrys sp.]